MKPLLIILLLAFSVQAQTFQHDKFSGKRWLFSKTVSITTGHSGLLVFDPSHVNMTAIVDLNEAYVQNEGAYSFLFETTSRDWLFSQRDCTVQLLINGERSSYPCKVVSSSVNAYRRSVSVNEGILMTIPESVLERIAKSGYVEMQVGYHEFKLKDDHRKEFAKVIQKH